MKRKLLTLAGLCAVAAALAIPASAAAVGVYTFHVDQSGTSDDCSFDVQYHFTANGAFIFKAGGATLQASSFRAVNTNPANGKSVVLQGAGSGSTSAPIDNGDGTTSYLQTISGNSILKDANGAPISSGAGRVVYRVTIDTATGNFISAELLSIAGTQNNNQDFCQALT